MGDFYWLATLHDVRTVVMGQEEYICIPDLELFY